MQVSILSGKGGTGKTTIAVNLAAVTGWRYVDCDVEEPNGFIFLKPEILQRQEVSIPVPDINKGKCILCKKCVEICQFHALGMAKDQVMFFEKLCHGCGACGLVCPEGAVSERERNIGKIEEGRGKGIECIQGVLNIGEPMSGPVIRDIKKMIVKGISLVDCAPGSSCSVVKAIEGSDYAILVTEPTEFGLHDLRIAVGLVRKMGIPFGLILNRADKYHTMITNYCQGENIRLLGVIPYDKKAAMLYSEGQLLIKDKYYRRLFEEIGQNLREVIMCS
ncbi:MAG: ATP-binding protein [Dehalobacterium sp.]